MREYLIARLAAHPKSLAILEVGALGYPPCSARIKIPTTMRTRAITLYRRRIDTDAVQVGSARRTCRSHGETMHNAGQRLLIWDLPTRVFHWLLVAAFTAAWVTFDDIRYLDVHVYAGYLFFGLLVFRLVWGMIGSRHARFRSFAYEWPSVWAYLRGLLSGQAARHVGHNPAGAWAIFLLLALGRGGAGRRGRPRPAARSVALCRGHRGERGARGAGLDAARPHHRARRRRRGREFLSQGKPRLGHDHRLQGRRGRGRRRLQTRRGRGADPHGGVRLRRGVFSRLHHTDTRAPPPPLRRTDAAGQCDVAQGVRRLPPRLLSHAATRTLVAQTHVAAERALRRRPRSRCRNRERDHRLPRRPRGRERPHRDRSQDAEHHPERGDAIAHHRDAVLAAQTRRDRCALLARQEDWQDQLRRLPPRRQTGHLRRQRHAPPTVKSELSSACYVDVQEGGPPMTKSRPKPPPSALALSPAAAQAAAESASAKSVC